MRNFIFKIGLIFLFMTFLGCMTVHLVADKVNEPVNMTQNVNKNYTIVKYFKHSVKGIFTLFNLVTISNPDIQKIIEKELENGDAVVNIKITGQTTFIDGLIPVAVGVIGSFVIPPYGSFLSNMIGLRTYTVEGYVVKYTDK